MKAVQAGVAVVLAMGVVALATIGATAIMIMQATWAQQDDLASEHVQAQALAQAGIHWARAVLADDRRLGDVDHPREPWASRLRPMAMEGGEISGTIEDQQGLFNLNNLVLSGRTDLEQVACFQRLLSFLGLPPGLADSLVDWMDADAARQSQGAEDETYRGLRPPYVAANQRMADPGELALVNGFDEAVLERLRPFVTALPRRTSVNANTASPELLAAMVDGLSLEGAREMAAHRGLAYFAHLDDFVRYLPEGVQAGVTDLSFGSEFFLASVRATVGGAEARSVALLRRSGAGWPVVVWRKGP